MHLAVVVGAQPGSRQGDLFGRHYFVRLLLMTAVAGPVRTDFVTAYLVVCPGKSPCAATIIVARCRRVRVLAWPYRILGEGLACAATGRAVAAGRQWEVR